MTLEQHMPRVSFSVESHFRLAFTLASVANSLSDKGRQRASGSVEREEGGGMGAGGCEVTETECEKEK